MRDQECFNEAATAVFTRYDSKNGRWWFKAEEPLRWPQYVDLLEQNVEHLKNKYVLNQPKHFTKLGTPLDLIEDLTNHAALALGVLVDLYRRYM